MRLLIILSMVILLAGCKSKECICTGEINHMNDKILADEICIGINENVADGLKYQAETFKYRSPDGMLGIFFRLTTPQTDPVYGYGKFVEYHVEAHTTLIPIGKSMGSVYHPAYDGVTFVVGNLGSWIPAKEMKKAGVPFKYYEPYIIEDFDEE